MNQAARLAELSDEELRHQERVLEEQIFRLRFQLQTGNAENPSRLRLTRKDLARVKTILRERQIGIERQRVAPVKAEPAKSEKGSEAR